MGQVTFRTGDCAEAVVKVRNGQTLMDAAVRTGVRGILAKCGGMAACATCHVLVEPDWLPRLAAPRPLEQMMLDNLRGRRPESRLACQIKMRDDLDGMRVEVPEAQGLAPARRAGSGKP